MRAVAVGATATLALGACAGDNDHDAARSATPTTAEESANEPDDVAAFCDAIDDIGVSLSIGEGYEGPDEAIVAAEKIAPEEIRADVTTMADESRAQVAAGPPRNGTPPKLPSDEFFMAATAVGDYMADNCGYHVIDVTATEYAFDGIPAHAKTGKTLVRLTNKGIEYHEVVFERVEEGETRPLEQLLALPQQEEGDLLQYRGSAFAPPGQGNFTVVDLAAGRHASLCFIPTGATTPEKATGQIDDTTPVHATKGAHAEIQVS